MKKYNYVGRLSPFHLVIKYVLLMKLTVIIILITAFQALAERGFSQQIINLEASSSTITAVLKKIEKKYDYRFVYNDNLRLDNQKIDLQIKNASIEEVMDQLLQNSGFTYKKINNDLLVIIQRETAIQAIIITGRITDEEGQPLSGVSVIEKGTPNGIATDQNGYFKISVENNKAVLVFSSVGYIQKEVQVGNKVVINITLVAETRSGDEVVVVGYGTQRRADLTGSISSLKGSDVQDLGTKRVDQALQGKVAGLSVLNTDGAPGGGTTIRVRGMNSIMGGNEALVVIDGLQEGDLKRLNPSDIESIEVLKDASATAIYGARGANGVILVTTKKGKIGKPVISYDFFYGQQKITKKIDVMSAAQFARFQNEYVMSENGRGANPQPLFTDAQIAGFEAKGFGTNWQDVIYRAAPLHNHELSVSGGTENTRYLVSAGYLDQLGIMKNSDFKRLTVRANLNADITKWASFNLRWSGSKDQGNAPSFGSDREVDFAGKPSNVALRWDAIQPIYDSLGNYSQHPPEYGVRATWNPLALTIEPKIDNGYVNNNLYGSLDFKLIPGLTLKVQVGGSVGNGSQKSFYNLKTLTGFQSKGYARVTESEASRFQNTNILTYDKWFKKRHHITFTGVNEQSYTKSYYKSTKAQDFTTDVTGFYNLSGAKLLEITGGASERRLQSYLGRLNYVFNDRYLLTASMRADGSSVFGANNKWGYFPSFAVSWKASNEKFIKDLGVFSDLKFRYSWGLTGNQAINPYQSFAVVNSGWNYPYNGAETTEIGFYIGSAPNPNLKWETTEQNNYGIDIGLFKNRLIIVADYYQKLTRDLLMFRSLPNYTGYANLIDNIGSVRNKGFELAVSGDPIKKQGGFNWNAAFTISTNRHKVLDLGEYERIPYETTNGGYRLGDANSPLMYLIKGESIGQMIGYRQLGTWKESERAQAKLYGQLPGMEKWFDANNDTLINTKDLVVIGNSMPKFIFGFNNKFSYKNFDLSILFQGTKGNNLFNVPRIRLESFYEGTSTRLLDKWTINNQNTDVPAIIEGKVFDTAGLVTKIAIADNRSSRWVEDASYIRLKNLTIGYTLPASLMKRIGFKSTRVYVSGTNLITWTKYTGYTPEVSSYNSADAALGVDFSSYPQSKLINIGVQLSF